MKGHPGGEENTRRLLSLAALPPGAAILDLGAGDGSALALMTGLGYRARGLDKAPRSPQVERGDFLCSGLPPESFDGVLSQCAFHVSGDQEGALAEARRLLRPAGRLMLADLFFEDPAALLRRRGFRVLHAEDMTAQWKDYYLEALWRGEEPDCPAPPGKCSYWLLIAGKEREHGPV